MLRAAIQPIRVPLQSDVMTLVFAVVDKGLNHHHLLHKSRKVAGSKPATCCQPNGVSRVLTG